MSVSNTTFASRASEFVQSAQNRWLAFWFTPTDSLPLGLIRILTGLMLTYNLCVWGIDLKAFFGANGLQPAAAVRSLYENETLIAFLHLIPDERLMFVHGICVAIAALFAAGVFTRVTSILAFLITISYSQRVPVANFGLDQLLGMLCLYLAIGPSGNSLSVDSLVINRWRQRRGLPALNYELPMACMTLRLIQLHLCVIYFWAGFAKLKGDTWWTGEAMWQVIANQEYQTMDLTWMAWVPWLPYLLAHITVAWEVSFCAMVWKDSFRPLWLAIGTAVHVGIGACLGMWTFGLIMTFPYFAFSDGRRWRRRLSVIRDRFSSEDSSPPSSSVDDAAEAADEPLGNDDPWAASEPYVAKLDAEAEPRSEPTYDIYRDIAAPEPDGRTKKFDSDIELTEPNRPLVEAAQQTESDAAAETPATTLPVAQTVEVEQPKSAVLDRAEVEHVAEVQAPSQAHAVDGSLISASGTDATHDLFRQTMGLSATPVRKAPALPRRSKWTSQQRTQSGTNSFEKADHEERRTMKQTTAVSQSGDHSTILDGRQADSGDQRLDEVDRPADSEINIDEDLVIHGESAPEQQMVFDHCSPGLLDAAVLSESGSSDSESLSATDENSNALPTVDSDASAGIQTDQTFFGEDMSDSNSNDAQKNESPDASHVLTTSKRMDRIQPKTANSLTGAPPPNVDGRVEDSVLAPETEVLLVAVHAPERNTFRTYLRRHDIPCRAAVSSENAVSVCLGMKPAAVLISGSMLNPEEILTLVDDLNDMIDAPILTLLTGAQVKLLSNDPMPAHILQYPASLRQIRAELMTILLEDGNARPRCSLRTAMMSE